MKQARPWMLANLKIIRQFHAHPVHSNSVDNFWAEIYRGRLFLRSNLVSFNRNLVVPYEISKVNFHAEFFFLSACQKRFNKIWKYQYNKTTFIAHEFRVSVISDVRERVRDLASPLPFMLRRSSLVECVSVLRGTCLQCAEQK